MHKNARVIGIQSSDASASTPVSIINYKTSKKQIRVIIKLILKVNFNFILLSYIHP